MTEQRRPGEFPHVIDNTIRSDWRSCLRKFYWAHIMCYHRDVMNIHLHFGGVFAKGLEVARRAYYGDGLAPPTAIAQAAVAMIESWGDFPTEFDGQKSLDTALACLGAYFERFPLGDDPAQPYRYHGSLPAVEFSFRCPLPGTEHPDTGLPIQYAGRFDAIMDYQQPPYAGLLLGDDEKTTGQMGANWAQQWRLRAQFLGYCWGAWQHGIPLQGMMVRGVCPLKNEIKFAETIKTFAKWEVERWLRQVTRDVQAMTATYQRWRETGDIAEWDQDLASACTAFGGCPYLQLCEAKHPEQWLNYYRREIWDPILGRLQSTRAELQYGKSGQKPPEGEQQ